MKDGTQLEGLSLNSLKEALIITRQHEAFLNILLVSQFNDDQWSILLLMIMMIMMMMVIVVINDDTIF